MVQIHPPLPFLLRNRSSVLLRKIFEHTADAGIHVEAETISKAFKELSLAFTEIITGGNLPDAKFSFDVSLESEELDTILINYVSYLIYLFDTENFIVSSVNLDIRTNMPYSITGQLEGESYDEEKHGYGVEIKAVSYHMLEISLGPPSKIIIVLDL